MHLADHSERASPAGSHCTGLRGWLNRRTGLDALLRSALDEPIPGGARLAYIFGSGLLFIFLSQIITGVFLALYYVPSADHAHTTVAYITKSVTAGSFLRGLHAYGASAMIVVLLLHLSQTYLYGAYKGRREVLWFSWMPAFCDGDGHWRSPAICFRGTRKLTFLPPPSAPTPRAEIPMVGESLKQLMRGGTEMGTLTISRFFVAHVFLIPACIFALVAAHLFLFRAVGAAGPVTENPFEPKQKAEFFYPRQILMDLSLTAAAHHRARLSRVFCSDPARPARESPPCPIHPAARVVLPAHFSVAEVLARRGLSDRRLGDSHDSGAGRGRCSVSRSRRRAPSLETTHRLGRLRLRDARAYRPRAAQQISGPPRPRSCATTRQRQETQKKWNT